MASQTEQLEETRGELAESIKQRKRERADLMSEMANVIKRIDKGKEQYNTFNQLLQLLHKEVNAIITVLKMHHALDSQDDLDRE